MKNENNNNVQRVPTLSTQIYNLLKTKITEGEISAGERLIERKVAKEFQISTTPVREAFARLERDGLVEFVQFGGVGVRKLSREELIEYMEIKMVLEGLAGEKAAQRIDAAALAELRQIIDDSKQYLKTDDIQSYRQYDVGFHDLIRKTANSKLLFDMMVMLRNQQRTTLSTSIILPSQGIARSVREHESIYQALASHDPVAARNVCQQHIAGIIISLQNSFKPHSK